MKKNSRVIFIGVSLLCFIAITYIDAIFQWQSVYWLIVKYGGCILIIARYLYNEFNRNRITVFEIIFIAILWLFSLGLYLYRDIQKYEQRACQDKFGKEFNAQRRSVGVPEIPPDWHIENRLFSVTWKGSETHLGHKSKEVAIDSFYTINYELDKYDIRSLSGKARSISILSKYGRGRIKDSIFYDYTFGDSTRVLSRQQADSIFSAEKIKKDY